MISVKKKDLPKEQSLLTPIDISNLQIANEAPRVAYSYPSNDILFNQDYMTEELNRFQIKIELAIIAVQR